MIRFLADATESTSDWSADLRSMIFIGCFVLVAIAVGIWWLRRG